MLKHLKKLFGIKPADPAPVAEVPYKVETPVVAPTPVAEKATEAVVASIAPAKKAPAKPKAPAKKAPAKKPAKAKSQPKA